MSITYGIPGYNTDILGSEEGLRSILSLMKTMRMERIDVCVMMDGDYSSDEDDDDQIERPSGMFERQLDVETDLLPNFCSHNETPLMMAGWVNEIRGVGQGFKRGADEFRTALQKYSIGIGFMSKYVKNDSDRMTAECRYRKDTGCLWCVHASRQRANNFFYIKKMNNTHTCGNVFRSSTHPRINSDLMGKLVVEKFRKKSLSSPMDVIDDMKDTYGFDITYHHAWKGADNPKKAIFGDSSKSFNNLRWYFDEARKVNTGSYLNLVVDPVSQRLQRCFIAFGVCIRGLKFIRPLIFLDGTFLKGRFKGVLLDATCKDGDQGIFPLAFAIVSSEDKDNWTWFMWELRKFLDSDRKFMFVSDRNYGLMQSMKVVFSDPYHSCCLFHLKFNLQDKLKRVNSGFRESVLYKF